MDEGREVRPSIVPAPQLTDHVCDSFKLHLRPANLDIDPDFSPGEIPQDLTIQNIYSTFLRYLFDETGQFIETSLSDGKSIWSQVRGRADFVLCHPNGWEGQYPESLRHAAVEAGLVPSYDEAQRRMTFLSEGEASALTCLSVVGPNLDELGQLRVS